MFFLWFLSYSRVLIVCSLYLFIYLFPYCSLTQNIFIFVASTVYWKLQQKQKNFDFFDNLFSYSMFWANSLNINDHFRHIQCISTFIDTKILNLDMKIFFSRQNIFGLFTKQSRKIFYYFGVIKLINYNLLVTID